MNDLHEHAIRTAHEMTAEAIKTFSDKELVSIAQVGQYLVEGEDPQDAAVIAIAESVRLIRAELLKRSKVAHQRSTEQLTTLSAALDAVADPHGVLAELQQQAQKNVTSAHKAIQIWSD